MTTASDLRPGDRFTCNGVIYDAMSISRHGRTVTVHTSTGQLGLPANREVVIL